MSLTIDLGVLKLRPILRYQKQNGEELRLTERHPTAYIDGKAFTFEFDEKGTPIKAKGSIMDNNIGQPVPAFYTVQLLEENETSVEKPKTKPIEVKFSDTWTCPNPRCGRPNLVEVPVCLNCRTPKPSEKEEPKPSNGKLAKSKELLK